MYLNIHTECVRRDEEFLFSLSLSSYKLKKRKKSRFLIIIIASHMYTCVDHWNTIVKWRISRKKKEWQCQSFFFLFCSLLSMQSRRQLSQPVRACSILNETLSHFPKNFYVISSTSYYCLYAGAVRRLRCVVINRKRKNFVSPLSDGHLNGVSVERRRKQNHHNHYHYHIITYINTNISNFVYTYARSSSQSSHFFCFSGEKSDYRIRNINSNSTKS